MQICEGGKQTIPIPAGLVEDEGGAMGLLWPFQIKKFPRQPIFSAPHPQLKIDQNLFLPNLSGHTLDIEFKMVSEM